MRGIRVSWSVVVAGTLAWTMGAAPVQAQLITQHIKGSVGLKAGSQAPPHLYVVMPLLYFYNTDTVRNRDGNKLPFNVSLTSAMFGAGALNVTTKKILGGNYAFQVLFPVGANNRIQGTEIDQNPGAGLTDSVVQPISLGWHGKRADAIAGYTIYIPTGRYTDGASNNTGMGMWGQELGFGTTVYLNEAKQYHAATMVSFNFQSKKEDSDTKVGNAMNFEGGVGGDFLKGGLTVGLDYYYSFKLTKDQIEGVPEALISKAKTFGVGPEVQLALARKGMLYGFLKMTYFWETYARTTTQGSAFTIAATFLVKPIKLP